MFNLLCFNKFNHATNSTWTHRPYQRRLHGVSALTARQCFRPRRLRPAVWRRYRGGKTDFASTEGTDGTDTLPPPTMQPASPEREELGRANTSVEQRRQNEQRSVCRSLTGWFGKYKRNLPPPTTRASNERADGRTDTCKGMEQIWGMVRPLQTSNYPPPRTSLTHGYLVGRSPIARVFYRAVPRFSQSDYLGS